MRAKHSTHHLPSFPIYSAGFVSDNELVLGGGGGSSRAGIKNKLKLFRVNSEQSIELLDELELEQDADAPMSMAVHPNSRHFVCGVNSAVDLLEKGQNENCRLYNATDHRLGTIITRGTLPVGDIEDYQRVSTISPDGQLVVAAGLHDLSLLTFPSLDVAASPVHIEEGEIYDATFSSTSLVIVTTVKLLVYSLPEEYKSSKTLKLSKTVDCTAISGIGAGSVFRSARFHPSNEEVLFTVFNTTSAKPRSRSKSKMTPRQAYVCKWNTKSWDKPKYRKVSDRGLTCFDISPDGKYLAFGSSDYTIGVLDSTTLAPLLTILKAHEFPPTTLRFNPTSKLLVSGSPDNSLRIVSIPVTLGGQSWTFVLLVLLTVLILVFAIATQIGHLY